MQSNLIHRTTPTPSRMAALLALLLLAAALLVPGVAGAQDFDDNDFIESDELLDPFEDEDFDDSDFDEDFDDGDFEDGDGEEWQEHTFDPDRDLDLEPTDDELGYICYRDGGEKKIDADAAIWLAKMIDGETWGNPSEEDAESMLWALAQRTGIWSFKSWELRRMVQAYSQPINPIWTRSGSKCRAFYADDFDGTIPERCSERRTRRRAQNIAKDWDELDEVARRAVLRFAAGEIANPIPSAVGWFAPGTWRSRERNGSNDEDNMVFHAEIDGNVYFAMDHNPDTTAWEELEISVVGPDSFCPEFVADFDDSDFDDFDDSDFDDSDFDDSDFDDTDFDDTDFGSDLDLDLENEGGSTDGEEE